MSKPDAMSERQERIHQQRLAGIVRANEARARAALLKKAVRTQVISDIDLLKGRLPQYDPIIAEWPVERLLKMMRGIGSPRCAEILRVTRLSPNKKVRLLSFEMREHLAELVIEAREYIL